MSSRSHSRPRPKPATRRAQQQPAPGIAVRLRQARQERIDALLTQKQLFENLAVIARATTEHPALDVTLRNTIEVTANLTGAESGSLLLLDESGDVVDCILVRDEIDRFSRSDIISKVLDEGLAGWVVKHRQMAMLHDTSNDERWLVIPGTSHHSRSVLAMPIMRGSTLLGVLTLSHTQPRHFNDEHIQLLQGAAQQMALALDNARLYTSLQQELGERRQAESRLREQNAYLSTLHETTLHVLNRLDLDDLLEAIVQRAGALVGTEHGYMYLVEPGSDEMVVNFGTGIFVQHRGLRIKQGMGVAGRVWATKQIFTVNDYVNWEGHLLSRLALPFRAVVGVPLTSGSEIVGVIGLAHVDPERTFDAAAINVLTRFAQLASLALDNARLYQAVQRELAERERAEAAERAAGQLREDLTRMLVHDLRNPLGAMLTSTQLLQGMLAASGNEVQAVVRILRNNNQRALALVTNILDVSRLEAGQMPVEVQPVALESTIRVVLDDNTLLRREKALNLHTHFETEAGLALADNKLVERVVRNLLSNAFKFTPPHGTIILNTAIQDDHFVVTIQDTGPGMTTDMQTRLFHKFATGRIEGSGTGLGLAFCKLAVEAMGGQIWAISTPQQGSTFHFTIPRIHPPQLPTPHT